MTTAAQTNELALGEVLSLLSRNEVVDGIMLLGSTGTGMFTPTSDIDLLIVLSELPAPLRIVNTWIDHRLAEIYCTTIIALERIVSASSGWEEGTEEGVILGWLQEGRVAFDRDGLLQSAAVRSRDLSIDSGSNAQSVYEVWRKIGYNVAQIRRYLPADDTDSRMAVKLRLLYSVDEVKLHYFTIRGIPWRGEKPAIMYWRNNDAVFLDLLEQYFEATDCHRRVEGYVALARHCLAPVGKLWDAGDTAISLGAGYGTGAVGPFEGTAPEAHDFWQELIG